MAVLCGLAAVLQLRPIDSLDMWWHIAQGHAVIGNLARSYPDPTGLPEGLVYTNPEWAFDAVLALLHDLGGVPLIGLAVAALAALSVGLCWRLARDVSGSPGAALVISALALGATSWRFAPRPQAVFLVLVPLSMGLAWRGAVAQPAQRRWWGLALLGCVAAWTQLHSSMVIAPVVVGALALHTPEARRDRLWVGVLAVCVLLPLAGPFGLGIVDQVLGHSGSDAARHITDMRPMPAMGWWPLPGNSLMWMWLLLGLGAWGVAKTHPRGWLWFFVPVLLGVAMTFTAHRFRAALALLAVPWVARGLAGLKVSWTPPPVWAAVLGVPLVLLVRQGGPSWPALDDAAAPVAGAQAIRGLVVRGPLFNTYADGGYLGAQLEGHNRVIIDGRTPVFFDDERYFAQRAATQDLTAFAQLDAQFGFQGALIGRKMPICTALSDSPEWAAVWMGERDALFVPRAHPAAAHALVHLAPCAGTSAVASCVATGDRSAHMAELHDLVTLTPDEGWLWRLGATLALDCGTPSGDQAARMVDAAAVAEPDAVDLPWLRGRVAQLGGDDAGAVAALRELSPGHVQGQTMLVEILGLQGDNAGVLDVGLPLLDSLDDGAPASLRCAVATAALAEGDEALAGIQAVRGTLVGGAGRCRRVVDALLADDALTAEQRRLLGR